MKIMLLIAFMFLAVAGCDDDPVTTNRNARFGELTDNNSGGNPGGVTFQVQSQSDQQGNFYLYFYPNTDVNVNTVTITAPQAKAGVVNINAQSNATGPFWIRFQAGHGITSGTQFVMEVSGTLVNGNTPFNVSVTFTVP